MKTLFFLALVSVCSVVHAKKEASDFSRVLLENVQADIQNENNDMFRKSSVGRGPASIESSEPSFEQNEKIEKNVKQLGPNKW